MPKSRGRKKADYTPPPERAAKASPLAGGRWVAPTMVVLLILGLLWIVVWYIAGAQIPFMESLGAVWNIVIGFGFIFAALMVSTRWK